MALSAEMRAKLRQAGGMGQTFPREPAAVTHKEMKPVQEPVPEASGTPAVLQDAGEDVSGFREGLSLVPEESTAIGQDAQPDDAVDVVAEVPEETAAGRPDDNADVDGPPVGIRYRREVGKQPRPVVSVSGDGQAKPLSLRIPPSLVDMCKRSSGDTAVANSNAVAAFLYAFRDKSYDGVIDYSDVPDGVVAFSRTFDIMKERAEFNKRVADIDSRVKQMADTQESLLWSMLYLIFDAAGLRTDHPDDPSEIGFGQDPEGFEAAMAVLQKAVSEHRTYVKRKEGRPIR